MQFGNILPTEPLDLGPMGAPGFSLAERIDFSGHGKSDPHINTDILNPNGNPLRYTPKADFRDITNNQIPGLNGMQVEICPQKSYGDSW